jgi:type I restriction enzyme S subunit
MKEGWTYKKLGEVCETTSGGTPLKTHKEYYEGGTIPWLRSGEIAQGSIYNTELYITELGLKNSSAKILPINTVVIAMYGATVGQVGTLKNEMATNQAVCGILPNSYFNPQFLMYFLKSKRSKFLMEAAGGAQANISQAIIKNTYIPIISLPTQQSIVSELDKINELIAIKKSQLKDLDTLAQSIFYEMFGDPITNEKGWEMKKLEDVCIFTQGMQVPIEEQSMKKEEGYLRFLRIIDFTQGTDEPRYVKCNNERYILHDQEIAMVRYGTPGFVCYGKYGVIANNLFKITPTNKDMFDFNFLHHWLESDEFQSAIKDKQYGAALQAIKFSTIHKINIIVPPLSLQHQFAERVESIERMKQQVQTAIKDLETLLASRMQYWFD